MAERKQAADLAGKNDHSCFCFYRSIISHILRWSDFLLRVSLQMCFFIMKCFCECFCWLSWNLFGNWVMVSQAGRETVLDFVPSLHLRHLIYLYLPQIVYHPVSLNFPLPLSLAVNTRKRELGLRNVWLVVVQLPSYLLQFKKLKGETERKEG